MMMMIMMTMMMIWTRNRVRKTCEILVKKGHSIHPAILESTVSTRHHKI